MGMMGSITGYPPSSASSIKRGMPTSASLHIADIADAADVADSVIEANDLR
jgi:hypothetical protein